MQASIPAKSRRAARELALQVLYALELADGKNEPLEVYRRVVYDFGREDADSPFARALVSKTFEHRDEFDKLIATKSANWDLDRIALLDRLILRMALCEFLYFEDIPPKVSIDEAIEIAKKYSTAKSGQFVNGLLDSLLADLKAAGRIQKRGRGLLDETIRNASHE